MKHQTHGDHWDALFENKDEVYDAIKAFTESGEFLYGRETSVEAEKGELKRTGVFAFQRKDGPISIQGIFIQDDENKRNNFISAYPVGEPLEICQDIRLKHTFYQWDNRVEANIEAETCEEESRSFNFFCTNYLENKNLVRLVDNAEYSLTAFALRCEYPGEDEMEIRYEGQKAVDWLAKLGKEPNIDKDGNIEPVVIDLKNMVAFLDTKKEFPDIVKFRSPVSHVEAFTSFGVPMYRMMITIFRGPDDINITLYVKQSMLDHMPEDGESVQGLFWLQGTLKSDIWARLRSEKKDNKLSNIGSQFLKKIAEMDLRNYDDLMPLMEVFDELKVRPGYVLDGFWADRGDGCYTKLYFSAEGSQWRYLPTIENGKIVPEFDDKMFIHNHVNEMFVKDLPQLTDYIEGDFSETAIFATYLLMTARFYLPKKATYDDPYRCLLLSPIDFLQLDDEGLGINSRDERIRPSVSFAGEDKAIVSCAFWTEKDGLCIEKTPVSRSETGYRFGKSRILKIV